jgi:hypothetical protein
MWRFERQREGPHWSEQRQRAAWSEVYKHMKRRHDKAAALYEMLVSRWFLTSKDRRRKFSDTLAVMK